MATETQRRVLEDFAKPRPDQLAAGDLEKHTDKYDFKSENVIELLKQLQLKFEDDKLAGTKAETNAINAYDLAKEARDNSIDAAEKSKKQKEKELATTKKSEWDTRSKTRSLEIEAMDQAVKILAKSTGVRTEAPGNPVPPASPVDFLQISQVKANDPKMKAVALLKEAAQDGHSRALERLAVEVAA